jgi:hypothetical protein
MESNEHPQRESSGVGHYTDSMPLTDAQRRRLCELMLHAFVDIRYITRYPSKGTQKQIEGLADAFHNLPRLIWKDEFSLSEFRRTVERSKAHFKLSWISIDYLAEIDAIIAMYDSP